MALQFLYTSPLHQKSHESQPPCIYSCSIMTGAGNLVDLLLFDTLETLLFNRMVCTIGKDSQKVKKAIALWLMLEEIGCHDLIRTINSQDNSTIDALFHQALNCIECIQPSDSIQPNELDDVPVFAGLFEEPMNLRFFYYNREFMYKRYVHVLETVCDRIFGETRAVEVDESGSRAVVKRSGEGSRSQVRAIPELGPMMMTTDGAGEAASRQSNLNPEAVEFNPGQKTEESRTMFLTFSKGYPLSREEIVTFFTSKWGEVVQLQDVLVERRRPEQDPQFGRIVFTSSFVVPKILKGQAKAKFLVNGKHFWARIYVPRHRKVVKS